VETLHSRRDVQTLLTEADRQILARVITLFSRYVEIPPLGHYRTLAADDLWLSLVGEVCVAGGSGPWGRLQASPAWANRFAEAVSRQVLGSQQYPTEYLAQTLRRHSATRFHNAAAKRLVSLLNAPGVFLDRALVLVEGFSPGDSAIETRDELIKRAPMFGLKSASDFMIEVGLSHDVIALDTRLVGIFQEYLGYNLTQPQIQGHRRRYLSLEAALRAFCGEQGVSLALLDRLLYRFGKIGAMDIAVKYPELWNRILGVQASPPVRAPGAG